MMARRYVEDPLQASIVSYVRTCAPECLVFAIPNGGLRSKREAARLKWTGVLAGVPDLIVVAPRHVLFIEVKAPKGVTSEDQKAVHAHLRGLGYTVAIARSIQDVRLTFQHLGIKTREAA
jgi:hypothetical protein